MTFGLTACQSVSALAGVVPLRVGLAALGGNIGGRFLLCVTIGVRRPTMTELTPEKIDELKAAHSGQLHELSGEDDEGNEYKMVSKSPTRPEWDRFQADILDDDRRHLGMRNLVTGCVVWPDRKELKELLNADPGLIQSFGKQIVTLSKARMEVTAKKL